MTLLYKPWLKLREIQITKWLSNFVDKHLYTIPIVFTVASIMVIWYLVSAVLVSIDKFNTTIQQIPQIIHTELSQTRTVLRDEANTSRQVVVDEHELTRADLEEKMASFVAQEAKLETQRHQLNIELQKIRDQQQQVIVGPVKPVDPQKKKKSFFKKIIS